MSHRQKWQKIQRVQSSVNEPIINAKKLYKLWGISLQIASDVMYNTTQSVVQWFDQPLAWCFITHQNMLGNHFMNSTSYTDTLLSSTKSVDSDTCAQEFVTDFDCGTV